MKLTLSHHTTQQKAIVKIDNHLNELMEQEFPGITVINPVKEWGDNIMRFSFALQKLFLTLEFAGNIIVTDQEVIGEGEIPPIVTIFFSEERIKEVITKNFNKLFNI